MGNEIKDSDKLKVGQVWVDPTDGEKVLITEVGSRVRFQIIAASNSRKRREVVQSLPRETTLSLRDFTRIWDVLDETSKVKEINAKYE